MIISIIVAMIIGAIVSGLTGIGFLFWIVTIFVFVCSLPFTLIDGYIQSKIDYVQDRDDYRQLMSDLAADDREYERQLADNERIDRILAKKDLYDQNGEFFDDREYYMDNRQVHFHNHYSSNQSRDSKGRFIAKKDRK
jgi:hypothetical protein